MKRSDTTTQNTHPDTAKLETGVLGTMRRLAQVIGEVEALHNNKAALMKCRIKPEREDLYCALEHLHDATRSLACIIEVRIGSGHDIDGRALIAPRARQQRRRVNGHTTKRLTSDANGAKLPALALNSPTGNVRTA